MAGARACPPEDCGGPPGYEELVAALGDLKHERHAELKEWLDGIYEGDRQGWSPEVFELPWINAALKLLRLSKAKPGPGPLAHSRDEVRSAQDAEAILATMLARLTGGKLTPEMAQALKGPSLIKKKTKKNKH